MQIHKNRAFSIIEILIVIVIVVVFVVIAYPQVTNYLTDREVKKEVYKLVNYIEEKKKEIVGSDIKAFLNDSNFKINKNTFIGHSHRMFIKMVQAFRLVNVGSLGQNRLNIDEIN